MKLLRIAAVSLAFGAASSIAQEPASEPYIDRFVAALPDNLASTAVDRTADPEQMARLAGLNPGRAEDIRPILETYQGCISQIADDASIAIMRDIARELGEAKIKRLTAFYAGPDYALFYGLTERTSKGESLSDAETATLGRVLASYPIPEFYDRMKKRSDGMAGDSGLVTQLTRCSLDKKQALIRAKVRYN